MKQHIVELRSDSLRKFSFQIDDQLPDFLCAWLSDWLKEYIEGGAQILDGQTLQFGYWPLMCKVDNDQLRLLGPDSESMPIRWQDDLSNALRSVMVHKYVPESYGFEMDVPRATETATVGKHFDQFPMIMNRMSRLGNGADSGWFLGSLRDEVDNDDPSQLSVVSLHEATLRAPWIRDYLSLPENTQVVFRNDTPVVLEDFEPAEPLPDSYVTKRQQADQQRKTIINVPLGRVKLADGLAFSFPTSMCCNCGTTTELSVLRQDTRQTTYLGISGTEITFRLPLPFCNTCAPSAKRRIKSVLDRVLMFALLFGATFLGLIILGEAYSLPQLSEYLISLSAAVAVATTVIPVLAARPKGNQTSYYQPVRISKLKREFISGKVVGIRFRFSNNDYARLFSSHNQEPIRSKLVEVEQ